MNQFLLIILILFISTLIQKKSNSEFFQGFQTENTNSTLLNLNQSRIGPIHNVDRILLNPKIRKEYNQIQRNFPLTTRDPLLQSSVSETMVNPQTLQSGGLGNKVVDEIVPSRSRRNRFKQNKKRVAQFNPTAQNERFNDSSGARNFIHVGPGIYDTRLRRAISVIKQTHRIKPSDLLGSEFQKVDRFTPVQAKQIKDTAQIFIDLLNEHFTKTEGKKSGLIWLDKEDAKIEKSFPIQKVKQGNKPSSNLQREFTRFTIVFFVYDTSALTNRGIKAVFIQDTTKTDKITRNNVFIQSAELVGEKGKRMLPGVSNLTPNDLWEIGRSRQEQKVTEHDIHKELKKREIQQKEDQAFCFGTTLDEVSSQDPERCKSAGGIYDRPVRSDAECPFYKTNKNYTNSRGGAQGGFCELPLGMNLKGFRRIDLNPSNKPLCYNCINGFYGFKTIGNCCEDQQRDRSAYPTLASPDYAFPT